MGKYWKHRRAVRTSLPFYLFFFNATATTEIYTLSLHDALPISKTFKGFNFGSGAFGFEKGGPVQKGKRILRRLKRPEPLGGVVEPGRKRVKGASRIITKEELKERRKRLVGEKVEEVKPKSSKRKAS